jgi:hypothetical protein
MDKILCPLCNKQFKTLTSHLNFIHKLKSKEFLIQYPNYPLTLPATRELTSKTCKKNGCGKWRKGSKLTKEHKLRLSERNSGINNPFYGKKHDNETKKRMSGSRPNISGDKNPFKKWIKSEKNYNRWSKSIKKYWEKLKENKEEYKKICETHSEKTSKAYIDGKLNPYGYHHKHGYFISNKFSQKFYYQSSYELSFLEFCETSNKIKKLQKNTIRINYKVNDINKKYIPDFVVNDIFIIEIKPKTMLNYQNNHLKFKAAYEYSNINNLKYLIITENELKNLDSQF